MTAGRIPSFTSVRPNVASSRGDDDVADGGQADAAAERRAVDPPDDGNRQRVEPLEHQGEILRVREVLDLAVGDRLGHPGDVGAGAECLARAGEHHHPHVGILGRAGCAGRDRVDDLLVERIAHLGPVQHDAQGRRRRGVIRIRLIGYIRKMPNRGSGTGALKAADSPRASACRVSAGSRMPSSHRRAVE